MPYVGLLTFSTTALTIWDFWLQGSTPGIVVQIQLLHSTAHDGNYLCWVPSSIDSDSMIIPTIIQVAHPGDIGACSAITP